LAEKVATLLNKEKAEMYPDTRSYGPELLVKGEEDAVGKAAPTREEALIGAILSGKSRERTVLRRGIHVDWGWSSSDLSFQEVPKGEEEQFSAGKDSKPHY